jgi:2-iminoacetate synthase
MTFYDVLAAHSWEDIRKAILQKTDRDVRRALAKSKRDLQDLMALLSPAAEPYLETMAQISHHLTLKRFGRTIQLYVPLYLSNECHNICTYCGFSFTNKISRKTLTPEEIREEARAIKQMGFEHILLVTGEAPAIVDFAYLKEALREVRPLFANISMEVQPLQTEEYRALLREGLYGVYIYQETYNEQRYPVYHVKGIKRNFRFRLETPDRLGQAGAYKIGLGVLLGLEDWRTDAWFMGLHLDYLRRMYWKTRFSISFPRLRPAHGVEVNGSTISDRELVQLITAFRLFDENVELVLSTREPAELRDHLIPLGITTMSAASRTQPGGYAAEKKELEQFEVADHRSPQEVAQQIEKQGYQPVWKDWDAHISLALEQ